MAKQYLRPVGLSYGADARAVIQAGLGLSLAGFETIAFSHIEVITRAGLGLQKTLHALRDFSPDELAPLTALRTPCGGLSFQQSLIMGIVNTTPDSFSDGGKHNQFEAAVAHGAALIQQGADILDIGGESTRPGAITVAIETEIARTQPVIAGLSAHGYCLSIDTRKAAVMEAAVQAGASVINDVSALGYDASSLATVAALQVPVVLMHAQGLPETMQQNPHYLQCVLDVYDYLEARIALCVAAGIPKSQLIIDPGIGFGKSLAHNLEILHGVSIFHGLGVPVLMGISRKSFIGTLTHEKTPALRVAGSCGGAVALALQAVHILRVHDVKETGQALAVVRAMLDPANVHIS